MNRILILLLASFLLAAPSFAKGGRSSSKSSSRTTHVRSYTKKDGTTVAAHDRTSPNRTKNDNWSTKGNVNPETGKAGTKKVD